MTSRLVVNSIRHTGASADAITMDASGNVTFPANATCSGTATGFGVEGIKMCDQWRITSSFTTNGSNITTNWERTDTPASTILVGNGMSESSGVFTFPETGIYLVTATTRGNRSSVVSYAGIQIMATSNNSSYSNIADGFDSISSANYYFHASAEVIIDISNTSTHKVMIYVAADGNTNFSGDSTVTMTGATFIRLGDT